MTRWNWPSRAKAATGRGTTDGRRPRIGAFTLVEMLLVVIMISILAGTVVVCVHGRRDLYALRTAAKDLAAAIRFAALEARASQTPHRVAFYGDMRSYRVETASQSTLDFRPARGFAGTVRPMAKGVRIASVSMEGRQIGLPLAEIRFDPNGDGFFGLIKLQNSNGQCSYVEVVRGSRQVHVCERPQ